jgi:hypothetical protein
MNQTKIEKKNSLGLIFFFNKICKKFGPRTHGVPTSLLYKHIGTNIRNNVRTEGRNVREELTCDLARGSQFLRAVANKPN